MSKSKLSDRTIKAMKDLANSSSWNIVYNNFILPKMQELESVYQAQDYIDKCRTDYELRAEILANIKAYGRMDMIVNEINKKATSLDEEGDDSCE